MMKVTELPLSFNAINDKLISREASVKMESPCVSPRWKSPEPCVLGRIPTSVRSGRISSTFRLLIRRFSLSTASRIISEKYLQK